jgi:hypothetical protein
MLAYNLSSSIFLELLTLLLEYNTQFRISDVSASTQAETMAMASEIFQYQYNMDMQVLKYDTTARFVQFANAQ